VHNPTGGGPPGLGERRIDDELTDIRNDDLRTSNSDLRGKSGPSGNGQPDEPASGKSERDTRADGQGEPRSQVKIVIPADHSMVSLLGSGDELLHVIEREFNADIHVRGNEITATGYPAETALITELFDELVELLRKGTVLTADAVERTAAMLRAERGVRPADVLTVGILSSRGRTIRPKTLNQKRYADAIDKHTIVFAIGPAGTGKTYLAMAKAVKALQAKEVNRIILTRPAVEAGERLGFLPGTLYEKIDPYLRPLYDALHDMIDPDSIPRLMSAGIIEIAPLAFMRGRTLNDSFIILDEAQNTSAEQMKMFLTRLGFGSQVVVTGDVTQVDLPAGQVSGLRVVQDILDGIEDIHFARLTSHDVVRHRLVGKIVDAYEKYDAQERQLGSTGHNTGRPPRRKGS
jgi:phosphate starvation-inducible protein PhoH and related proteins